MNCGTDALRSETGLLTSVAWSSKQDAYALEGSIFVAGSAVQWLRDGLKFFEDSKESEKLASVVESSEGLIVIPAFVGLGAPHWKEACRGSIFGITRNTNQSHIALATLEGVAHQVADILELHAFHAVRSICVDGGMVQNELFCQILSDLCGLSVIQSEYTELSALGAAKAALIGTGLCSLEEASEALKPASGGNREFLPKIDDNQRATARSRWTRAISSVLQYSQH